MTNAADFTITAAARILMLEAELELAFAMRDEAGTGLNCCTVRLANIRGAVGGLDVEAFSRTLRDRDAAEGVFLAAAARVTHLVALLEDAREHPRDVRFSVVAEPRNAVAAN